jgi:hypothetical protein
VNEKLIFSNPFEGLSNFRAGISKQTDEPFSKDEITAIIQGFRTDRYYSHYI